MDTATREEIAERRRLASMRLQQYGERREAWAAMHGGLKESHGHCCLRRLQGLKCLKYHQKRCEDCDRAEANRAIWDHPTIWIKGGKPYMIVLHPYYVRDDELNQLQQLCGSRGLVCNVRPKEESFYRPGGTWMIEISRKVTAEISEEDRLKALTLITSI
ncbi:MAG TPA: hypothetical protein VMX94_13180 [Armatimonadota bacterium]|nr:hypothetical protein [Armatimonadota bacterium]